MYRALSILAIGPQTDKPHRERESYVFICAMFYSMLKDDGVQISLPSYQDVENL